MLESWIAMAIDMSLGGFIVEVESVSTGLWECFTSSLYAGVW